MAMRTIINSTSKGLRDSLCYPIYASITVEFKQVIDLGNELVDYLVTGKTQDNIKIVYPVHLWIL